MEQLFAQGHAVDLVLAVMLAETVWLVSRRGVAAREVMGMMLPGALILLAARAALTESDWRWIALPLALSFPAHLGEVMRRGWLFRRPGFRRRVWRRRAAGAPPLVEPRAADQDCVLR